MRLSAVLSKHFPHLRGYSNHRSPRRPRKADEAPFGTIKAKRPTRGPGKVASGIPPRGLHSNPRAERIGPVLSVVKDELHRREASAAKRVKATGILGGERAPKGKALIQHQ